MDTRRGRVRWGPKGTRSRTTDTYWKKPLKWNRDALRHPASYLGPTPQDRPRVFCASLADVFEDWDGPIVDHKGEQLWHIGDGNYGRYTKREHPSCQPVSMSCLRRDLFELIDQTPNLDWLLLTKRPENIRRMWPVDAPKGDDDRVGLETMRDNVWLGCSVSDQQTADEAIPKLVECRDLSPCLFLSVEPLVGPVDLTRKPKSISNDVIEAGILSGMGLNYLWPDWVIVGGESGPNARPCNIDWIRSIVRQCREAGVRCWVKQLGSHVIDDRANGTIHSNIPAEECWPGDHDTHHTGRIHLKDRKGADPTEWPEDVRVQESPVLKGVDL